VRRDPEHLPERLALFAVQRLGEPSRLWAREALADGADPGVVATQLRHQSGRVARIDGAISGTPFFLALLPGYLGYLWQEAMMVLRTAALYGHHPGALRTGAEMLALRGIHPTVEAARAAIEHVNTIRFPTSQSSDGQFATGCAASEWCWYSAGSYRHRPART
jgi:hypothetical protein